MHLPIVPCDIVLARFHSSESMQNDPQEIQSILQMHLKGSSSLDEFLDAHLLAVQYISQYTTYQLLSKLWKQVIYKVVQEKRKMLKDNKLTVHSFTNFVNYMVGWFSLVLTRLTVNQISFPVVFHCYIYMGDLARYRDQAINGNMIMAIECYKQAEELWPQNGLVHHQIAVIATLKLQDLEALYRYIRSLYGSRSPDMAGPNLRKFLEKRLGLNVPDDPPETSSIEKALLYLIKVNMNQTELKSAYSEFFISTFRSNYKQLAEEETKWVILICSVLPDNDNILTQLLNLISQLEYDQSIRLILLLLVGKHLKYVPPGLQKYLGSVVEKPSIFLESDFRLLGFTPLQRAFQILQLPVESQSHEDAIIAKQHFESNSIGQVAESLQEWVNYLLLDESSDSEDEFVLHQHDPESQLKQLAEQTVSGFLDDF